MANSVASKGVIISGAKTVTTAGTAEALATSGLYSSVVIIAEPSNTGQIYVGGSDVASTTNGGLDAGDVLEIRPSRGHVLDLTDIYIDASVSTDGVDFYATV